MAENFKPLRESFVPSQRQVAECTAMSGSIECTVVHPESAYECSCCGAAYVLYIYVLVLMLLQNIFSTCIFTGINCIVSIPLAVLSSLHIYLVVFKN